MPRAKTERKIGNHTDNDMRKALQIIHSSESIRKAAKELKIAATTIRRYYNKLIILKLSLVPKYDINKVFTNAQERDLKQYFIDCSLMFYGLTTDDCRQVAYQMAKINNIKMPKNWEDRSKAGIDWLKGFRKRHAELSLRKPELCSLARATAFNKANVKTFFDNLEKLIKRHPNEFSDGTRI
ncbi:unnamed protein product [Psylliodes chrysocephalus]|uniref:HTH CENPB-type domain-containing protein n=1 Tax=Psylliodes chrysocephalus TaxID=3402493 RepID=A0A9P0GG43_9CUCU|nr:unnamed protein product [Psylliodes chrysocephala]